MLLISAAQKKGSKASRVLLNTDEAEAAPAAVGPGPGGRLKAGWKVTLAAA